MLICSKFLVCLIILTLQPTYISQWLWCSGEDEVIDARRHFAQALVDGHIFKLEDDVYVKVKVYFAFAAKIETYYYRSVVKVSEAFRILLGNLKEGANLVNLDSLLLHV